MKTTFIMNGSTRLVLTPETEAEEVMLKQLTSQDNIITNVGEGSHIALTYGNDSVIIMKSDNVTSQAEEV
jgi:UDP-N-acetylenolpyruvoylglucosamine reductase